MDLDRLRALVALRSGAPAVTVSEAALAPLGAVLESREIGEYARFCLPPEPYGASGVNVMALSRILDEIAPWAAPGGHVFPWGYLPIASSVGGNLVVLHADGAFWADHTGW